MNHAQDELQSVQERASFWIQGLHDDLTEFFTTMDRGGAFVEDKWTREGGGGGVTRILTEGATFEKAGVNRSAVFGALSSTAAQRLGGRIDASQPHNFFATGLSVVAHPRSPRIPTVHLNVRYFEVIGSDGSLRDAWFGGGTDLTPTYPEPADARHFHRALHSVCSALNPLLYVRFKPQCDDYFRNVHRGGEARGVGGIFFDHLRPLEDESGLHRDALFRFCGDVARSLRAAYGPIVDARRDMPHDANERALQLERRGRYVEFNLLHDRGTAFGLQTGARVESVFMSLPPLAAWPYNAAGSSSALREAMMAMLAPRDWLAPSD